MAAPPDSKTLRQWFEAIDTDHNGYLSVSELQAALAKGGMNFSLSLTAHIIRQCDKDGSGTITFPEFERLNVFLATVQASFSQFDSDHNGRLSMDEIGFALMTFGYSIDRPALETVFQRFDPMRQGWLGPQEFMALTLFLRSGAATFKAFDSGRSGNITMNFNQFLYACANTI